MFGLDEAEIKVFQKLSTPNKIQDYLDSLPINHEKNGETCFSPRRVLREQKAHCLEGALFGATALWFHGQKPLIVNMQTARGDDHHSIALFRIHGYWGALSKTNHGILRFRDAIYKNVRELVLSYFNEYFLFTTGKKTLRAYSKPLHVGRFGTAWITSEEDVWHIADTLATSPHLSVIPEATKRFIRPASLLERKVVEEAEWGVEDPRT